MGDEYPVSGDAEEWTEEELKDELLRQYMAGKLAPVTEQPAEEEAAEEELQDAEYPVSSYNDAMIGEDSRRLTPNQAQMRYLLHTDDVPKTLSGKLWSLVSRHLELIDIPDYNKLPIYHREIRDIIRTSLWRRDFHNIPYSDICQIEFYSGRVLLPKSLNRGERTLLATSIVRQQAEELGERTPNAGMAAAGMQGGFFGGIRNLFGMRR